MKAEIIKVEYMVKRPVVNPEGICLGVVANEGMLKNQKKVYLKK